ncbi:MAG: hypothetical protein V3V10_04340, partial [Planctomycetota bacterium]
SLVGEGSEKVMYHLGVNKAALNELRAILQDDPSGYKAAAFIGQKKAEITGSKHKQTSARKPAAQVNGEVAPTLSSGKHKKAYDKAVKANDAQGMYNAKKLAKAGKVDVSNW